MTETERTEKFLVKRDRRALMRALLAVALLVSVGVNVGIWWQAQTRAENAEQTVVTFAQQVQDACDDGGLPVHGRDLCDRADQVVEDPAAPPVPAPGKDGDDAPPPTDSQVADGVAAWFNTHDLSLTAGYSTSMQTAVARYLSRNPPSAGEPGEDAPAPTDQQIATAAAAYLMAHPPTDGTDGRGVVSASLDGCYVVFTYTDGGTDRVGPICGADGHDGADGKDGRGFVDVECLDTGDWIFTLDDGTALTVAGPCRAVEPTPTPTPTTTLKR